MFHLKNDIDGRIFLLVYVDGTINAAESVKDCEVVMEKLQDNFKSSTLSDAHFCLGLENQSDRGIGQYRYCKRRM